MQEAGRSHTNLRWCKCPKYSKKKNEAYVASEKINEFLNLMGEFII
jgi:hypothetical protein